MEDNLDFKISDHFSVTSKKSSKRSKKKNVLIQFENVKRNHWIYLGVGGGGGGRRGGGSTRKAKKPRRIITYGNEKCFLNVKWNVFKRVCYNLNSAWSWFSWILYNWWTI